MTEIIKAKVIADQIKARIIEEVGLARKGGISPALAIIRIGKDPASEYYFNAKIKRASELGIETRTLTLEESVLREDVFSHIERLSNDPTIHGIIVESPVPEHLDYKEIVNRIAWQKDVDGATFENLGRLMSGQDCLVAATPLAVMEYIKHIGLESGSRVVVINRTITVGRPLSQLLLNSNFTPIICHSRTIGIDELCRNADAIVVAAGKPAFLKRNMVNENSIVIDVGINSVGGRITGDADSESLNNHVRILTPVPGGVGSLTSLIIFANLMTAIKYQYS